MGTGAVRWAIPGTNLFWSGTFLSETAFRIIDVTEDATNTYIQTSLAGGFPALPMSNGKLGIRVHPAPKITCSNCTGGAAAVSLSQAPAGAPIYSYSKRIYTGDSSFTSHAIWGKVTNIKFNATTPYTGATNPIRMEFVQGIVKSDGSAAFYHPFIDLRTAGLRTVTPSGVTGAQSGDSALALPDPSTWFAHRANPAFQPTISGEPSSVWPTVTIEIITDQGVVNP